MKKHTSHALQKGRIPGKRVFLGGNVFPRKRGLESFWVKCLKQNRFSDNVSFIYNHPSMSTYTIEMLHGKIIRENLYTGKNQEQYIAEKGEKNILHMPCKREDFPGRGFSWGAMYFQENGAWRAFGASVLNKFEFLTMYHLYTITHQCQHIRLKCYTGKIVYGKICIRERIRNSI